jgi:ABC-type oligopeptide transport system substrate-binding subunit
VELFPLADGTNAWELYDAGGLDICWLSPPELSYVRQRFAEEYFSEPWSATRFVGFNVNRPPFDDPRVRQAFAMAIDREHLAGVILGGYSYPATGGLVPPGMPGHSPGIELTFDPEQARTQLAATGFPNGQPFPDVRAMTSPWSALLSEGLKMQWQKNLGVEIAWETPRPEAILDELENEPAHLYCLGWAACYPDPDSFLRACPHLHQLGWRNERYDRQLEHARRAADSGERMRSYEKADQILIEDAGITPLTYERRHRLVKPWVTRFPSSATIPWFWKEVIIEPH